MGGRAVALVRVRIVERRAVVFMVRLLLLLNWELVEDEEGVDD